MDSRFASRWKVNCKASWARRWLTSMQAKPACVQTRPSLAEELFTQRNKCIYQRAHLNGSAVAVRHVAFEDLGLLAPVMEREGWDVSFCEAAVDDLRHDSIKNAKLLLVLGGRIGASETETYPFLKSELALIEHRLSRDLPTLGICLGSQL